MQPKGFDWQVLRGALLALASSLAISGLILAGSFYFAEEMHKKFIRDDASFKSASRRYLAIDEEERLIKKYYPVFVDLYHNGALGKEHRLNWIEVLKNAGDEIKPPSLNYQIATQKLHTPAFPVNLGRYQVYASTMSLNMQLLHEGDLFRLFAFLDKQAKGVYTVLNCHLRRSSDLITDDPAVPNITVQCELEWFTIKRADGTELEV